MGSKSNEISAEMYHRIYRLAKKNVANPLIAATLKLPLETVQSIVARITGKPAGDTIDRSREQGVKDTYLDLFISSKTHFHIIDLAGYAILEHQDVLKAEFEKINSSNIKALAIRLKETKALDQVCAEILLNFYRTFTDLGHYAAILDPAHALEPELLRFKIDPIIQIFGTESAFEQKARSTNTSNNKKI